ncbi:cytochrome c [Neorhizobium sp. DAR64872/K0K18]|uniref:cytochrome c n=1 Tax=Neorhizobium sp. DAR64872/K0K18 TaxID=3421958 RepID=UPI003D2E93D4
MTWCRITCFATAFVFILTGGVLAAPAWERQLDMKAMAEAARAIGELFSGKRPYSQQEFKSAAEVIRRRAGDHLIDSFQGEQQPDSKANAGAIASSAGEFEKLAHDLQIYASALSSAADQNAVELGPDTRMSSTLIGSPFGRKLDPSHDASAVPAEHAYHLMLQTCTSCHAKYRKP